MFKNTRNPQKEKNKIKVHVNIWLSRVRDNKCIQRIKYMRRAGTPQFSAGSLFPQKVTRKEIYFIFFYEGSSEENPDQVISTRKKKKFLSGLNTKRAGWLLEMYCARVQQVVFPFWFFGDSALSWTVVFF